MISVDLNKGFIYQVGLPCSAFFGPFYTMLDTGFTYGLESIY